MISRTEFNKKVEIEYAYLICQKNMSHEKASIQARQVVTKNYQAQD